MKIMGMTFEATSKEFQIEHEGISIKVENTEKGIRLNVEQGKIDGRFEGMIDIIKNE